MRKRREGGEREGEREKEREGEKEEEREDNKHSIKFSTSLDEWPIEKVTVKSHINIGANLSDVVKKTLKKIYWKRSSVLKKDG